MLQANLAIILTFITTLIDELAETYNLTNPKLIVIALAFITVMFLFNYTLKEEGKSLSSLTGFDQATKQLQNNINMLKQMPNQIQGTFNQGVNMVNKGASHINKSISI